MDKARQKQEGGTQEDEKGGAMKGVGRLEKGFGIGSFLVLVKRGRGGWCEYVLWSYGKRVNTAISTLPPFLPLLEIHTSGVDDGTHGGDGLDGVLPLRASRSPRRRRQRSVDRRESDTKVCCM